MGESMDVRAVCTSVVNGQVMWQFHVYICKNLPNRLQPGLSCHGFGCVVYHGSSAHGFSPEFLLVENQPCMVGRSPLKVSVVGDAHGIPLILGNPKKVEIQ